jgi:hypothetical protein
VSDIYTDIYLRHLKQRHNEKGEGIVKIDLFLRNLIVITVISENVTPNQYIIIFGTGEQMKDNCQSRQLEVLHCLISKKKLKFSWPWLIIIWNPCRKKTVNNLLFFIYYSIFTK